MVSPNGILNKLTEHLYLRLFQSFYDVYKLIVIRHYWAPAEDSSQVISCPQWQHAHLTLQAVL